MLIGWAAQSPLSLEIGPAIQLEKIQNVKRLLQENCMLQYQ